MKKLMISAALVLLHLAATPGLADSVKSQSQQTCRQEQRDCQRGSEAKAKTGSEAPQRAGSKTSSKASKEASSSGPRRGEVIHGGRALQSRETQRLAKPATGRGYRVVEDRVVLVDESTMKVVQVLGLASELLR